MAQSINFNDFNAYNVTSEQSTALNNSSEGEVNEGETSLHFPSGKTVGAYIWGQSETDSPTEAQVTGYVYPNAEFENNLFGVFSRFQDINNHYGLILAESPVDDNGNNALIMMKREAGSYTKVDEYSFGTGFENVTLSDGTKITYRWFPFRITFWIDSANDDFRVRFEEDADEDGTWSQLGNDLVDPNPSHASGGGIGVGFIRGPRNPSGDVSEEHWYDGPGFEISY